MRSIACAVVDLSYPSDLGVGAQIVRDLCLRYGADIVPPSRADVILASACHPSLATKIPYRRWSAPVILGGFAGLSPAYASHYATAVVVGDCQQYIESLCQDGLEASLALSNVYIDGETRPVVVDQGFPWAMWGYRGEDNRERIWCSVGCKRRCAFCQVGWSRVYSEHPDPDEVCSRVGSGARVSLVSNALSDVSYASRLPEADGASHTFASVKHGIPRSRTIRLGIEGVSERLRSAVGKPISNEDLCDETCRLMDAGRAVRWFMIAGLPGESALDWDELRDVVMAVGMHTTTGVLQISFTAYCPEPATPIYRLPYDDGYYELYCSFRDWYFRLVRRNRIAIFNCEGVVNRAKKAVSQLDCEPGGITPNTRVQYPHRAHIALSLRRYLRYIAPSQPPRPN